MTLHWLVGQLPNEVGDYPWVGSWYRGILESVVLHTGAVQIATNWVILESVVLHRGALQIPPY